MIDMKMWGVLMVPETVTVAADYIARLAYVPAALAKIRRVSLPDEIGGALVHDIASLVGIPKEKLDCGFASICNGAEPQVDALEPENFESTSFMIPVILPKGDSLFSAGRTSIIAEVGGVYEFNHGQTHSMQLEDNESGCVVIMVAVKK